MRPGSPARFLLRLCILFSFFAVAGPAIAAAQEFDATALTAPVDLAGPWRVHAGDDPAFASPSFDDSRWPSFDARDSIAKTFSNRPPIIWYRLRVRVRPGQEGLGLREWDLSNAFEAYVNGRRVLQSGSVAPFKPYTYDGRLLVPISSADTASGSLLIALRVYIGRYAWDRPGAGLWYRNLTLGQYAALDNADWLQVIGDHALSWLDQFAWFAMGIVGLALFGAQRSQREYLWMFLSAVTILLGQPLNLARLFHTVPATWELARQPVLVANVVFNLLIFFAILRVRFNWWFRGFIALACAGVVITWFGIFNGSLSALASILVQVPVGLIYAVILPILLLVRYRRGNREAGILLIAALCQSFWYYIVYANAFLIVIPATARAALNFAQTYLNPHIGPILIDFGSLAGLLYVLCLSIIIVLRATRVSRQQALMESELEAARQVQQVILPEQAETVPGYIVESIYKPAQQVGGDFFQIVPDTTDNSMLIVAGDVTGKGLKAGMLVALLIGAIRSTAETTKEPLDVLEALNRRLLGRGDAQATCLALRVYKNGTAVLANAGHLPPYLNGQAMPVEGALPLGIVAGAGFSVTHFNLNEGDRLVLISDGIAEATNANGELFGFDRVVEMLRSRQSIEQLASAAQSFGQEDDITVLSLARQHAIENVVGASSSPAFSWEPA